MFLSAISHLLILMLLFFLSLSLLFTFRCLLWWRWCVHRKRYSWNQSDDVMPVYTRVKRRIPLEARNNYLFNWISNVSKTNMLNSHWTCTNGLFNAFSRITRAFSSEWFKFKFIKRYIWQFGLFCFCVAQKTILITTFERNWIDRKNAISITCFAVRRVHYECNCR